MQVVITNMEPNTKILNRCGPDSLRLAARLLGAIAELQDVRNGLCSSCSEGNMPIATDERGHFVHFIKGKDGLEHPKICEARDIHRASFKLHDELNLIEIGWRN